MSWWMTGRCGNKTAGRIALKEEHTVRKNRQKEAADRGIRSGEGGRERGVMVFG
ncbi:Uncharacterised protein [Roseburia hominis]|nr:Uncharacterised protein [Roseburia hominis]